MSYQEWITSWLLLVLSYTKRTIGGAPIRRGPANPSLDIIIAQTLQLHSNFAGTLIATYVYQIRTLRCISVNKLWKIQTREVVNIPKVKTKVFQK